MKKITAKITFEEGKSVIIEGDTEEEATIAMMMYQGFLDRERKIGRQEVIENLAKKYEKFVISAGTC